MAVRTALLLLFLAKNDGVGTMYPVWLSIGEDRVQILDPFFKGGGSNESAVAFYPRINGSSLVVHRPSGG